MSLKKTLFLAVILFACVVYITRVEYPKREEAERKGFVFPQLEAVQLEYLSIKRLQSKDETKPSFAIGLSNNEPKVSAGPTPTPSKEVDQFQPPAEEEGLQAWSISGIPGAKASGDAVKSIVAALKSLKLDDPIPPDEVGTDLSVFGLKDPVAEVEVKRLGIAPITISVGGENEYLMKRYIKVSGDSQIYLILPPLFTAIDKSLNDFRDKSAFDFEDLSIKSIAVGSPTGVVTLGQSGMGYWELNEPVKLEASMSAVNKLLAAFKGLVADEFVDDGDKKLAEYGLNAPDATIDIAFKDSAKKQNLKVLFSKKKGSASDLYYLVSGYPTVYRATNGKIEDFLKSVDDLRNRELFKFTVDTVKTAEFSGSDVMPLKIVNLGNGWKVNDKDGDNVFVDQLMYRLRQLPAEKFVKNVSSAEFVNPRYVVNLVIDGSKAEEKLKLTVGVPVKDVTPAQYYARVGDEGEVFTITEDVYKKIRPMEETLIKQPELFPTSGPTGGAGK